HSNKAHARAPYSRGKGNVLHLSGRDSGCVMSKRDPTIRMYAFDSYAKHIPLTRGVAEIFNMTTTERMVARRGRHREGSTSSGAAFLAGRSRINCVFVDHPEKNRRKRRSRECDISDRRRRRRPLPLVSIGALASAAVVLLLSRTVVEGQYTADTLLFEENMEKAE
ncbi:unnamed protein product, partial [Ectocarpus sp. 12 AP-2014]